LAVTLVALAISAVAAAGFAWALVRSRRALPATA
jgi:hypothetical protein